MSDIFGFHGSEDPYSWIQLAPLKCWYPTKMLHSITTQKTST